MELKLWYNLPIYRKNMANQFELGLIFFSVLCGVLSATYLYQSADIFVTMLKRPLKFISAGIMTIAAGVLLAAFLSYESQLGSTFIYFGVPLQAIFFLLYIIGSIFIFVGARQFVHRPNGPIAAK
jgi:hypothetical protein